VGSAGDSLITYDESFTSGGPGFRPLNLANEYYNETYAAAGNINATNATNQNSRINFTANNADATLTAPTTVRGLVINNTGGSSSDVILGGNLLTVESGIILNAGNQDNQINAGTGSALTAGPNAATGYDLRIHGARTFYVDAPTADNASHAVSVLTDGTVFLRGVSTYSGGTTVQRDVLTTNDIRIDNDAAGWGWAVIGDRVAWGQRHPGEVATEMRAHSRAVNRRRWKFKAAVEK